MTLTIRPDHQPVRVTAQPLSQDAFSPFGSVIANPRPDIHPSAAAALPANAASANQGSAIRYRDVSPICSLYDQAPSGRGSGAASAAEPVMSVFVCSARELRPVDGQDSDADADALTLRVLERHPFTTQTFSPLSSTARTYLVVVAPSLPLREQDQDLDLDQDRRLPDLRGLRAFVATNAQAVTYGAGTWHAPMVVLGRAGTTLDFVVWQFASGVPEEDCQTVGVEAEVRVPRRLGVAKL
ncbi:hypothetical protein E4U41_002788 [Claviceps citrina]|nr:hypothetical protein E4U41_002788 [Claviceps citrina]